MRTTHACALSLTNTSKNHWCFRVHAVIDYLFPVIDVLRHFYVLRHYFVLCCGIRTLPMSKNADGIKLVEGSLLQLLKWTLVIQ
jgi:hypothetical protein